MVHISMPAETPAWLIVISLTGALLIGLTYGLVRLVRAALPDTPAERLNWWVQYWKHRRNLRRDRWERRDQLRLRRRFADPNEFPKSQPGRGMTAVERSKHSRVE